MMSDVPVFQNLRTTFLQPTWLAIFISVGLHGMIGISWPNLPFGNNESERWKTVDIIELTPSEQRLLPNLSTPPAQLVIPPAPPVINTLPALPRDQSKVNLPKLPPINGGSGALSATNYPVVVPSFPLFPPPPETSFSGSSVNQDFPGNLSGFDPSTYTPPPDPNLDISENRGWGNLPPENAPAGGYGPPSFEELLAGIKAGETLTDPLPERDSLGSNSNRTAIRTYENSPPTTATLQSPPPQTTAADLKPNPGGELTVAQEAQILYMTWAMQMAQDQQDLKIVNQHIVITAPFPKEVKDQEFAAAYVGVRVDSEGKFVAATPVTLIGNPTLDSAAQNVAKSHSFPATGKPTTYPVIVQFTNTPATAPGNTQTPTKPQPTQQPTPQRTKPPISRPGDSLKRQMRLPTNSQTVPAPQPTPADTQAPVPAQPTPTETQTPVPVQPNVEQPPALPETPLNEPAGTPTASPENQQPPAQTEPAETEPTNSQPPATPVSPAPQPEYTPVPANPDTPEESTQPSAETSPTLEESVNPGE